MRTTRWTNPSLPQTLQLGMFLLYIGAVFGVLFGAFFSPIGLIVVAGDVAAGFGIANERRWGYILGIVMSVLGLLPFAIYGLTNGIGSLLSIGVLFELVFPVIQFVALVHVQSREYQKVWFH
jgi:hypothetical protein